MEPAAQPAVPPTQIPKSKGGCACCAMGCTSMFVLLLVGMAMIIGLLWWGLGEVVKEYTASGPIAIATETTDAEYAAAEQKYNALAAAARARQTVTVQLNASEVNALIARHPEFADMRGKFRVAMADSLMTLEMSVPLREINLPRIRDRWLNGSARFGLLYHDGNFNFSLRGLSANERELSMQFLQNFAGAFNEKFNERFHEKRRERDRTHDFWEIIRTLAIVDDQLVITTKGPEAPEPPEADRDAADEEAEPSPTPGTTI
ncbi:MAG: hypothetical protein ABIR71_05770 [Chthoniobacterales bacterium]